MRKKTSTTARPWKLSRAQSARNVRLLAVLDEIKTLVEKGIENLTLADVRWRALAKGGWDDLDPDAAYRQVTVKLGAAAAFHYDEP